MKSRTKNGQFKRVLCKDNAFSSMNVSSCYWAGVMASDGCIKNDKQFTLTQSKKRLILIDQFKKYLEYEGKTYYY